VKELVDLKFDLQKLLRKLIVMLAVFCAVTVITGGLIWIKIDHQNTEAQNARVTIGNQTGQIQKLNERILSCTDPKGSCFKENQARTAQIIGRLTDAQIAAIACRQESAIANDPDPAQRAAAINSCVRRVLAGD
jgi:hypothetical protein